LGRVAFRLRAGFRPFVAALRREGRFTFLLVFFGLALVSFFRAAFLEVVARDARFAFPLRFFAIVSPPFNKHDTRSRSNGVHLA
jgi:hypothetical protein